jgi:hypothetical protein
VPGSNEHDESLLSSVRRQRGDGLLLEVLETSLDGKRLPSHLKKRSPLGHHADRDHLADALVGVQRAVRAGYPDPLPRFAVNGDHLANLS